jgi:hypothetical protein
MMAFDRLISNIKKIAGKTRDLEKQGYRDWFIARLGSGDGVTVTAPDNPAKNSNYLVYYYTDDNIRRGLAVRLPESDIPYANGTAYHGLEIIVGKAPLAKGWGDKEVVIGLTEAGAYSASTNGIIQAIGGNEGTYPSTDQFMALRVNPKAGMVVTVRGPYYYQKNNPSLEPVVFTDTDIDLTSFVPTGTDEQMIGIVYLNPNDNTLGFAEGDVSLASPLPSPDTITEEMVNAIDTSLWHPAGVVYLYKDQVEITEDDVLRDFEVRSIFIPPYRKVNTALAGVYTTPDIIQVDPSGRVIFIQSGTGGGSGGVPKTVKFENGSAFDLDNDETIALPMDTVVTNDDSAGDFDAGYFQFTAPQDANYRIAIHLVSSSIVYSPSAIITASYFDYPSGDPVPVLTINADDIVGGSPFDGVVYQNLSASQVIAFEISYIGSPFGVANFNTGSYIEITWTSGTPPLTDANTISVEVPFTFATTFPLTIRTVGSTGERIMDAQIYIETPFDDGATFTIGDSGDNDRIMTSGESRSGYTDTSFSKTPSPYNYSSGDIVRLYKPSGTPTTGSGIVTLILKG